MLALLGYVLIGLFTGLVAKRAMPLKITDGSFALGLVGMIGSLLGGLAVTLLFSYGRSYDYWYGYTMVKDAGQAHASGLPAYWISFITALAGALLALSIYKLMRADVHNT